MNRLRELEIWAAQAAQELQAFVDDAQQASGNPNELKEVRSLIREYRRITARDKRLVSEYDMAVDRMFDRESISSRTRTANSTKDRAGLTRLLIFAAGGAVWLIGLWAFLNG